MPKSSESPKTFDKFDEYKFFIDDTARLSERRQGVTSTYITVNTAVIGVITFLATQPLLQGIKLILAVIPVVAAGVIICYFWYTLLMTYKRLLCFRFKQLEIIEAQINGCHGMYKCESNELYSNAPKKKQIEFSKVEARLPIFFGILYFLTVIGVFLVAL